MNGDGELPGQRSVLGECTVVGVQFGKKSPRFRCWSEGEGHVDHFVPGKESLDQKNGLKEGRR